MATSIHSASTGPVPSTLPMSPDRSVAGKLVGNLYIAAKILIEGHNVSVEAARHEIRVLTSSATSSTSTNSSTSTSSLPPDQAPASAPSSAPSVSPSSPGAPSPLEWKKFVTRLLLATQKLPPAVGCLPDGFKREVASAIRQGKQLCGGCNSVAAEALKRVDKAAELYRSLSGPSYL
jgi:hypothetical protein